MRRTRRPDWYVFEAASWALAGPNGAGPPPRIVARGHSRRVRSGSFVTFRCLRRFRAMSFVPHLRPDHGKCGTSRAPRCWPNGRSRQLHLLLTRGACSLVKAGRLNAPGASTMGLMEALQSRPRSARADERYRRHAGSPPRSFGRSRLQHPDLVEGCSPARRPGRQQCRDTRVPDWCCRRTRAPGDRGMQPIEKVLAIERVPVFAHISPEEARYLAAITAHNRHLKEGRRSSKLRIHPAPG